MKVTILGCGPSGLFAAHAALSLGHEVQILSRRRKSQIHGARYLHHPIPGLNDLAEGVTVRHELFGTAQEYAAKVYGESAPNSLSAQRLVGLHKAWCIRTAYLRAWDSYQDRISDVTANPTLMLDLLHADSPPDIIVSTVPANALCYQPERHFFTARDAWSIVDAPGSGINAPRLVGPFTVACNGTREAGWYRASNILGMSTVEWPGEAKPPLENVVKIPKPVKTNCDCYRETNKVWRAGRTGTWIKGYREHDAYWGIREALGKV